MPQDKRKKKDRIIDPFETPTSDKIIDPFEEDEIVDPFEEGVAKGALRYTVSQPLVQQTISTISPVLDLLARPSYGSARFSDALADDSKTVLDAISEGLTETFGTGAARTKITYSDVIRRRFPEFATQNPKATTVIGFVGDVVLDPTSYLGFGLAKEGITVGGKVVSSSTRSVLRESLDSASRKVFIGKDGTLELVKQFPKTIARAEKAEAILTKKIARAEKKGIDEVVLSPSQANIITRRIEVERELKSAGYFDAVRNKQDEIERFLTDLSGIPNTELAQTLAKTETLSDLKRIARGRQTDELFIDEVREKFNQRIIALTQLNPELRSKLFAPKGVYLKAGLPFGRNRDVMRLMGLEGISNRVKALSAYIESSGKIGKGVIEAGRVVRSAFNRNYGLPEEYIKFRDELENELGYLSDEMIRTARKLFKDIDQEGRERIGEAMHWTDDQTRFLEELRPQGITDEQAAQVLQRSMDKFKLTDTDRALVSQMQQHYKEAGLLEMRAGLLKNNLVNYSPRGYEIISDAADMSLITRGKYGLAIPQPYLASSHQRKFMTKAEAEAAGLVPELDAAILYAHRMLSSKRALAIKQFKDSVTELFGTYSPRSKIAHTGILPTTVLEEYLPRKVIDDMKMIGEAVYPSGMNDTVRSMARGFDKLQRFFKRAATTYRPSFAGKQLISNTFQAALVSGLKAFKALDPRVAFDAAILLMRAGKPLENLPPFLTNFISKHFTGNEGLDAILASRVILSRHFGEEQLLDFAKQFKLKNALGQEYSGEELIQLAREKGVIRGFDSTGEAFSQKLSKEITKDQNSYKNVVGVLGRWANHAAMIEDYGRMMLFINGIRMGKTADESIKLVNKALFDYSRGLSDFEKTWVKRLIPFYSFQRFAIPFVLKQSLAKPGNPATIDKLMRTTEKLLISGEELNHGEVDIFNESGNNVILEQPRLLSGFAPDGKGTLNILNNLTPFDVLNLAAYDENGDIDPRLTVQKTFAAAITPFIKVPFEWLLDKDFFTDRTIEQASTYGNLEGSLGKILPEFVKDAMSWETRKHQVTGKVTTYVNPFMSYYVMQFVPAIRDYIKPMEDYEGQGYIMGPVMAAARIYLESTLPFKRREVNLKEMGEFSLLRKEKEFDDIEKAMFLAKLRGSDDQFEKAQQDLQNFFKVLAENSKNRAGMYIRGTGIGQQPIPEGVEIPTSQPQIDTKEYK